MINFSFWPHRPSTSLPSLLRSAAVVASLLVTAGCELQQKDPIEPEDVLIAEGRLIIGLDVDRFNVEPTLDFNLLLHRSRGLDQPGPVEGATVRVTNSRGQGITAQQRPTEHCLVPVPDSVEVPIFSAVACYSVPQGRSSPFRPGDTLTLDVSLPSGELLTSTSTVPGRFSLANVNTWRGQCWNPIESEVPLEWTPADGTWVYLSETNLLGLGEALASKGIVAPDHLFLNGLSVSQDDIDIVFPQELGIFDRFDLERDLATELQKGVPEGVVAEIAVSALDRNYVNWARGGSFNPSGAVRISSVSGDGTGMFGTAVRLSWVMFSGQPDDAPHVPQCVGGS